MTSRPKLTILSGDGAPPTVPEPKPQNQQSIEERIGRAFTGAGNRDRVLSLYRTFKKDMALVAWSSKDRLSSPRAGDALSERQGCGKIRPALPTARSARQLGRRVRHSGGVTRLQKRTWGEMPMAERLAEAELDVEDALSFNSRARTHSSASTSQGSD
eukprot:1329039-Prymnesium_polylepis.1